tara:strand:- start:40 stop:459 length:420 start_codon:yes stop_codon:yes gene_type:complete
MKQDNKKGEIKTWNEGKPHITGGSGALGLIGGVLGRTIKTFSNAAKQFIGKGAKPASGGSRLLTTKPKPSTTSVDNWGRPGLPKLTNEYGTVLGKGDLMRRGIRPGAHGGYQVKYKAGLDAAGKQKHGWRYTHPFEVKK